ncbi:MAG: LuxR C-terminal-related transcriptional regulator [Pelobacteraceae bacterium]
MPKLTTHELKILKLLATGKSNKQIAAAVCVCEKTIEFHLAKLYTKSGERTRIATVVWALQKGLVTV